MFPHVKLDWSLRRLEGALEQTPEDTATRVDFSRACLSRARFHDGGEVWFNRALTQARRVLQDDPANPVALVVAGMSLVGLDRLDPAQRYLDQAMRVEPERPDLHLALSDLHAHSGDKHQALRALESACRLAPDAWEPNALLGLLLADRGHELGHPRRIMERSQFHVVRAMQIGPSDAITPDLLLTLAVSCLRTGRLEDAQKLFTKLAEFDRHQARTRYYRGLVAYHMGKYKKAVLFLRQHLQDSPENPHVWARIAMCYLHLGEVVHAREACNRALAVEPDDLQARWTLGCALLEEDRVEEATKLFREILTDAPHHAPAFTEFVRIRRDMGDHDWLLKALRAEVGVHDKHGVRLKDQRGGRTVNPRASTRERIQIVLRALGDVETDSVPAILEATALTADEGLRFTLWEAALDMMADRRARQAVTWLNQPGAHFSGERGRQVLTLSTVLPEPLLTRGLQLAEEDLRRAAVDRHHSTHDVTAHRQLIDHERNEARAWQALLLLSVASRQTRTARNLLVRWGSEADSELALAASAALAMLGDPHATEQLRAAARAQHCEHLVDTLQHQVSPPEARIQPRPVSDDEALHCSTCGRQAGEVDHLMAGSDAAICDRCMTTIARQRRQLLTDDPQVTCALSGATMLDSRAIYLYRGISVSAECVDQSLGLMEREEVDRFLAAS